MLVALLSGVSLHACLVDPPSPRPIPPTRAPPAASLQKHDGSTVPTLDELGGNYVCVLFSASWCPPCDDFTVYCRQFWNVCAQGKGQIPNIKMVLASCDNSLADFESFFRRDCPWGLSVPFGCEAAQLCARPPLASLRTHSSVRART